MRAFNLEKANQKPPATIKVIKKERRLFTS